MPTRTVFSTLFFFAACGGDAPEPAADSTRESSPLSAAAPADRAERRMDTVLVEGSPEPIQLRLFRSPDDFPLPFSAYVPDEMSAEGSEEEEEEGAAVRFVAEFGGVRGDLAFIHLFVHPAGTDPQQALAVVRAYQAATGVPVSRGLEPLGEAEAAARMAWADHAYTFRYQAGGSWYLGTIGLGTRHGRLFHLAMHYPAEYGDGFVPRAELVLETWRWADRSPLRSGAGATGIAIPSKRPDSLPP